MAEDLTLSEAHDAFAALAADIGSKAEIWPSMNVRSRYGRQSILSARIKPDGLMGDASIAAHGETWRELVADARSKWDEYSDLHAVTTIRAMALEIITLTADLGECTDAALRAKFDAADVTRYGERACAQATEMAGLGPFSIVTLSGANQNEAA